jgi:hypothetical protein
LTAVLVVLVLHQWAFVDLVAMAVALKVVQLLQMASSEHLRIKKP